MTRLRIHADKIFDGQQFYEHQVLTIEDGKVLSIDDDTTSVDVVVQGMIAPGFIDLQVNGGGGVLFNDSPSLDNLKTIITAHSQFGTTGMLPTLITDKVEVMAQAADAMALAIKEGVPGILGIHFEGPHLSVAKKGTHVQEYIRAISEAEWQILERKDIGQILVTLAPETVSTDDIHRMVSLGIKVCLGHTNADFKTAQAAMDVGADGYTHLFNAMSSIESRAPGVTGCALLNDQASCGMIIDGHHVDYTTAKLALKTKPQGKVFLVTDAMSTIGTDQTEFSFFDRTVYLNDGRLTSTTGELAGAALDMATAVKNTHLGIGIVLDEAIRMASQYPADYINQGAIRGNLSVGAQADFVILNDQLGVESTWIGGQRVYTK
ncbi:N-acetylglucosamine-6-phosphate deacetylase [Thalassotalea castellviae]|uniref:N-acetylgalactosamine-6-phosphate deacetylase n=1 Tax=Thalassotalea castellviae TaxID=3075612 RepID=A0ABU2ZZT1_9GAMM|nr:N-acetylglucosamine-6-phosphate deacetylase [Thalassotalea sp. W431]MDT0603123.1 N-acetylglucosamine-6-phosphate deacetylase [Thalassotalea sp. W431]